MLRRRRAKIFLFPPRPQKSKNTANSALCLKMDMNYKLYPGKRKVLLPHNVVTTTACVGWEIWQGPENMSIDSYDDTQNRGRTGKLLDAEILNYEQPNAAASTASHGSPV